MSRLLTEEELNKAYMGSDYHPDSKIVLGIKHGVERVADESQKATLKTVGKAINDYAHNKISFERLAELLGVNAYELDVAFRKRGDAEHKETLKAVGKWLESCGRTDGWCILNEEVEILKRGEMPEEGK